MLCLHGSRDHNVLVTHTTTTVRKVNWSSHKRPSIKAHVNERSLIHSSHDVWFTQTTTRKWGLEQKTASDRLQGTRHLALTPFFISSLYVSRSWSSVANTNRQWERVTTIRRTALIGSAPSLPANISATVKILERLSISVFRNNTLAPIKKKPRNSGLFTAESVCNDIYSLWKDAVKPVTKSWHSPFLVCSHLSGSPLHFHHLQLPRRASWER